MTSLGITAELLACLWHSTDIHPLVFALLPATCIAQIRSRALAVTCARGAKGVTDDVLGVQLWDVLFEIKRTEGGKRPTKAMPWGQRCHSGHLAISMYCCMHDRPACVNAAPQQRPGQPKNVLAPRL